MRVFKFLEAKFARANIEQKRIKISRIMDLNDPFELLPINTSRRPDLRHLFESWRKDMDKEHGLLCFSRGWRDPVLWSHYGEKHRGICLGYDLQDSLADPVRYRHDRVKPRLTKDGQLVRDEALTTDMLYTKYERWQYEEEIRVYVELDPKTVDAQGHYFYEYSEQLALREVILGPLCDIPMSEFHELVKSSIPKVNLKQTRLAFSKYSVVERDPRMDVED